MVSSLRNDWSLEAQGTPPAAELLYGRDAFSVELMQMTPPWGWNASNESQVADWAALVARGDSMLIQPWYNSSQNVFVKKVYETAATLKSTRGHSQ